MKVRLKKLIWEILESKLSSMEKVNKFGLMAAHILGTGLMGYKRDMGRNSKMLIRNILACGKMV